MVRHDKFYQEIEEFGQFQGGDKCGQFFNDHVELLLDSLAENIVTNRRLHQSNSSKCQYFFPLRFKAEHLNGTLKQLVQLIFTTILQRREDKIEVQGAEKQGSLPDDYFLLVAVEESRKYFSEGLIYGGAERDVWVQEGRHNREHNKCDLVRLDLVEALQL